MFSGARRIAAWHSGGVAVVSEQGPPVKAIKPGTAWCEECQHTHHPDDAHHFNCVDCAAIERDADDFINAIHREDPGFEGEYQTVVWVDSNQARRLGDPVTVRDLEALGWGEPEWDKWEL